MKISIIMTVLNGEKYLDRSISSFLNQDYKDKEMIIIDNKSTDNSHKIIEKYKKTYPILIKWIKKDDSSISEARNIALNYVSGDIIGFLGVDDILHKDFFEKILYYAEINPNYDILYFDGYGISNESSYYRQASHIPITVRNLIKYSPIASGECFYYKKYIFNNFSFNENNKLTMDYELNFAIAYSKKYQFYGISIPAIFNISDGNNISANFSIDQRCSTIIVQLKYIGSFLSKIKIILKKIKFIIKNYKIFKKYLHEI